MAIEKAPSSKSWKSVQWMDGTQLIRIGRLIRQAGEAGTAFNSIPLSSESHWGWWSLTIPSHSSRDWFPFGLEWDWRNHVTIWTNWIVNGSHAHQCGGCFGILTEYSDGNEDSGEGATYSDGRELRHQSPTIYFVARLVSFQIGGDDIELSHWTVLPFERIKLL
jgi:hypothetical protein